MKLELDDLHLSVRDAARAFATAEIVPKAREWDRAESFDESLVAKLGELGFWGILLPEAQGGVEFDTLAYATIVEALAGADGAIALAVVLHNALGAAHLASANTDAPLDAVASGETLVSWSSAEDSVSVWTDGDDIRLDGVSSKVPLGVRAGQHVVLATEGDGVSAFVVSRGAPGLTVSAPLPTLGCRGLERAELRFEGVVAARLGAAGMGSSAAAELLPRAQLGLAALALGLGEGALAAGVAYALEREQFKRPIAKFQAIQWKVADARTQLDAARMLVLRAAVTDGADFPRHAAMAKVYATEAATRAASEMLQVFGGYGYTRDFPVERQLRDLKSCAAICGGGDAHRTLIAAQTLSA